ncbi:NAD(P)/FAD-dependent oxidoreductase, partial [Kitasatospora indigofera]
MPTVTARTRVLVDRALSAATGADFVSTGFRNGRPATLPDFEHTGVHRTARRGRPQSRARRAPPGVG